MPTPSFKKRLNALSLPNKVVGAGAIIGIISVFSPWYQDIDKFHTGDMFFGISGPLYLLGATLLLLFGGALTLVISEGWEKHFINLPVKNHQFFMISGGVGFYLLCLAYSIFFHPQFGLNLVDKQPMFGLFGVLIASGLVSYGGYMAPRAANKKTHLNENRLPEHDESIMRDHQPMHKNVVVEGDQNPVVTRSYRPTHTDEIQIKSDLPQTYERH